MKYLSVFYLAMFMVACTKDEVTFPYSNEEISKILDDPFKYGMLAKLHTYTELDTFGSVKRITVITKKKDYNIRNFTVNDTIIRRVKVDTNAFVFQIFPNMPKFNVWKNNLVIKLNDIQKTVKPIVLTFDNLPGSMKLKDKVNFQTREGNLRYFVSVFEYNPTSFQGNLLHTTEVAATSFTIDDNLSKGMVVGKRYVFLLLTEEVEIIDNIVYQNSCFSYSKSILFSS